MPHHFLIDALPFVDVRHIFSCPGPETSREAVGFILAELPGENGLSGIKTLFDKKRMFLTKSDYNFSLLLCTVYLSLEVYFVS
jgi:hypothetical protein